MMDFASVAAWAIPAGEVIKLEAGGVVLWELPQSGDLPAGYTPLEYIQFSGAQHVDTGVIPDYDTTIEIVFTRETSEARYMYGVRNSDNTASVTAYLSSSGAWRFGRTYKNFTLAVNNVHTAVVDRTGVVMDGKKSYYGTTVTDFTAAHTLIVGTSRGTSGSVSGGQFIGKIYEFRMLDGNDVPTAEWKPCKNPDGVCGFYDTAQKTFRASLTSTALTGG